jgi:hypothetical protein
MGKYADFHKRSIEQRDDFWAEQAKLIDWQTPPQQICDFSRPPFSKWFVGGKPTSAITRLIVMPRSDRMTARWFISRPRPTRKSPIPLRN